MDLSIPVSSVMTVQPVTVEPSHTLLALKHIYEKEQFHHHVPVTDDGLLVGMISLRDFLAEVKPYGLDDSHPGYLNSRVMDIMSHQPVEVQPETTLREACEILSRGQVHALAVTKAGRLQGILSTADVLRYILNTL